MKKMMNFLLLLALLLPFSAAQAQDSANPEMVVIPGTIQSELGCVSDWLPDCENTALVYDAEDDVWQGTFLIEPGNDQDEKGPRYKAAINGGWGEIYGLNANAGGADIPLGREQATEVKFYCGHKSHWATDSFNSVSIWAWRSAIMLLRRLCRPRPPISRRPTMLQATTMPRRVDSFMMSILFQFRFSCGNTTP